METPSDVKTQSTEQSSSSSEGSWKSKVQSIWKKEGDGSSLSIKKEKRRKPTWERERDKQFAEWEKSRLASHPLQYSNQNTDKSRYGGVSNYYSSFMNPKARTADGKRNKGWWVWWL